MKLWTGTHLILIGKEIGSMDAQPLHQKLVSGERN